MISFQEGGAGYDYGPGSGCGVDGLGVLGIDVVCNDTFGRGINSNGGLRMKIKCDFAKARAGDKVWHFSAGWGTVLRANTNMGILFESDTGALKRWFLFDGRFSCVDPYPSLYWDELKLDFDIPEPPKRMVKKVVNIWATVTPTGKPVWLTLEKNDAEIWEKEGYQVVEFSKEIEVPEE